jgi:hypothetical protein
MEWRSSERRLRCTRRRPFQKEKEMYTEVLTQFLTSFFVHTSDLNNTILETQNYLNWARLIAQEFQSIAQAEAHFGLPVTQMLVYKNEVGFYNSQKGFSGRLL